MVRDLIDRKCVIGGRVVNNSSGIRVESECVRNTKRLTDLFFNIWRQRIKEPLESIPKLQLEVNDAQVVHSLVRMFELYPGLHEVASIRTTVPEISREIKGISQTRHLGIVVFH